jgi:drug/metabolite transporter (DMT)-like permease
LHLAQVAVVDLAIQVIFQGIVVTIISLVLYCRAVLILGASRGSAFGALVPALSAVLAIPLTGERPTASGWVGIVLISAGVYLASGGTAVGNASRIIDDGRSTHNDRHSESFRFPSF